MANLLNPVFLLLFILIPVSVAQLDELLFSGFKDAGPNLTLNGIAEIEENGILRLTNETSRLMGHAFYPSPFNFKNSTNGKVFSFSTSFALAIVPEYPRLGGHGLAFTIATSKELKIGPCSWICGFKNASIEEIMLRSCQLYWLTERKKEAPFTPNLGVFKEVDRPNPFRRGLLCMGPSCLTALSGTS